MKLRFFGTILLALVATAVAISTAYYNFFQDERLRLIDYQIENSASVLISSNLSADQLQDFDRADEIIHRFFGDDRLNLLVVIYNASGRAVYKSENARLLPPRIGVNAQWQTLQFSNHFIRLLTLPWRDRGLILQVGLVMDDDVIRWKTATRTLFAYSTLVIVLVFVMSVFLTKTLLNPMKSLSSYLQFVTERFDRGLSLDKVFDEKSLPEPKGWLLSKNDEFVELTRGVKLLSQKLRASVQLTQRGTAQLAHEIKTPLTIIRNHLEMGAHLQSSEEKQKHLEGALVELDLMNGVVEEFLMWARTENLPSTAFELDAIAMEKEIKNHIERFLKVYPDRLSLGALEPLQVFARLSFVQQLLNNLISNALKYSSAHEKIEVEFLRGVLKIRDRGPGLPAKVIEKLGEPFNSESIAGTKGSGLGLAWVLTICRKYGWKIDFQNRKDGGLEVSVNFQSTPEKG